jgi:hypothetical protein
MMFDGIPWVNATRAIRISSVVQMTDSVPTRAVDPEPFSEDTTDLQKGLDQLSKVGLNTSSPALSVSGTSGSIADMIGAALEFEKIIQTPHNLFTFFDRKIGRKTCLSCGLECV